MSAPKDLLTFEPHNGFGGKTPDGDMWPFGYLSTVGPRVPVFELNVIVNWSPKVLLAYAHMAAAAPDMLEALTECAEEIKRLRHEIERLPFLGTAYSAQRSSQAVERAHAAIAKAEGRA